MSSVILPEKAVQVLLTNKFEVFNRNSVSYLEEIFPIELYGQRNLEDWASYFADNKVKVKLGWPNEETSSPAIYISAADANHDENVLGFAQRYSLSADAIGTDEAIIYAKSAKVIAAVDNYNVSLILAAICQYFIHQEHLWFEEFNMTLPRLNFQELDFMSQYWPQKLFYRTFIVTFMTVDTIMVAKDDVIKGINVDMI